MASSGRGGLRGDILDTGGKVSLDAWVLIPFSRGYVHDPYLGHMANNPQYYLNELDVLGQAAASRLARKLCSKGDMQQYFAGETRPSYDIVPQGASLEDWVKYVQREFRAIITLLAYVLRCPKKWEVWLIQLRECDVERLRVVDGSIRPTQLS